LFALNEHALAIAIEAIFALLLAATIASFPIQENNNAKVEELLILQKENDLLKVWLQQQTLQEKELLSDFEFVFPNRTGTISVAGKKIEIKKNNTFFQKIISSSAFCLSENSELLELRIAVYQ
jgi:hypothetical protein